MAGPPMAGAVSLYYHLPRRRWPLLPCALISCALGAASSPPPPAAGGGGGVDIIDWRGDVIEAPSSLASFSLDDGAPASPADEDLLTEPATTSRADENLNAGGDVLSSSRGRRIVGPSRSPQHPSSSSRTDTEDMMIISSSLLESSAGSDPPDPPSCSSPSKPANLPPNTQITKVCAEKKDFKVDDECDIECKPGGSDLLGAEECFIQQRSSNNIVV